MNKDEYGFNGWKNWATWSCNLHLTNDEATYNRLKECKTAEEIKNLVEDLLEIETETNLFKLEALQGYINDIDFYEILRSLKDL